MSVIGPRPQLVRDLVFMSKEERKRHTVKPGFPNVSIGFSDHSVGYVAAVGAAILGVSLIEKHFTLDKNFAGPDHKASATPEELKALVENVRRIEVMGGEQKRQMFFGGKTTG